MYQDAVKASIENFVIELSTGGRKQDANLCKIMQSQ